MAAELEAHGGQNFVGEVGFSARSEALVERLGEDGSWRAGFDGGQDGPAAFAGIGNFAAEFFEGGGIEQGDGGEIEQPGSDNATAAPDFGDVSEVEVVLVVLGVTERRGFGVGFALVGFAGVGVLQDIQAFGVGGHDAVLDAVVHHFDEVARAAGAAMEIAFLGSASGFFAARSAVYVAATGSQRFEDGIEVLDDVVFPADHLAVAALEAPNATGGADVDIVDALAAEFLGAADVVDVVGIAAIDEDVSDIELAREFVERGVDHGGGNHEPDGARLAELLNEFVQRAGARGAFGGELLDGVGAAIVDHGLVAVFLQPADHVGAHSSETDHSELHFCWLL